jgi:hypothetical protein
MLLQPLDALADCRWRNGQRTRGGRIAAKRCGTREGNQPSQSFDDDLFRDGIIKPNDGLIIKPGFAN